MLVRRYLPEYLGGTRGAAAAEFALLLSVLSIPLFSAIDLGIYVYQMMEVQDAVQMAAQAAWAIVPSCTLPVTVSGNCSALTTTINTAAHSTPLTTSVSVTSKTENYYCLDTATNALVTVGTFPGTKPSNCSSVGLSTDTPGDYLLITASFTYSPVFSGISIAGLLTPTITQTVWMRLS